ncbi:transcriptional regulator [Taibaiella sp. KBW10]|nr:transcriptional regulator [Taibaiella sp. KBW10]
MVDLKSQYLHLKEPIDTAIQQVLDHTGFIKGKEVTAFSSALANYTGVSYVIPCANGTDALQIALMALGLQAGDEVITPSFTYFATAEVIALLGLKPVFVDVDPHTFNIDVSQIAQAITPKTKAIIPVHLFGQSADMEAILDLADQHGIAVIEDNAQALGGTYTFSDGSTWKTGSMGTISCTSFFPSKNLGCYGDGGAICTKDEALYERIKMIANHGQKEKYHHEIIGCNSRLDTIQAAILNVKLPYLDQYCAARIAVATQYNQAFAGNEKIKTPFITAHNKHVFHQYTLQLHASIDRTKLKAALLEAGIPSMVYYPIPCHLQKAMSAFTDPRWVLPHTEQLAQSVLSLPIHTEMSTEMVAYIAEKVIALTARS